MKKVVFTDQGRADVSRLDIPTAKRIFTALQRFAEGGAGEVRKLQGDNNELRLRVGDWRVRFIEEPGTILVKRVRHRSEAYR